MSVRPGSQGAAARLRHLNRLEAQVRDLMGSTRDAARSSRLRARLGQINRMQKHLAVRLNQPDGACVFLEERPYKKPGRPLTMQEERVDFVVLNERFNDLQTELEDDLEEATWDEVERASSNVKNKLDAGDIAGLAALAFLFRGRIRETLNAALKKSYGTGKNMAAKETGIERPATPLAATQLMNLDSADLAEQYAAMLEAAAKGAVKDGFAAGAATSAIVSSMRNRVLDEGAKAIGAISGTVTGQYLNRGRGDVFRENITRIVSFQRSEVLDNATCDMCLSLDGRVVSPDDPAAAMDVVHTHCRGLWVPVFTTDDTKPDVGGIPKSIMDNFDTVDGRPTVNAFKQLKKANNRISQDAQAQIRARMEKRAKK